MRRIAVQCANTHLSRHHHPPRTQDEFGIIDVVQEARTRSLYFGAPPQQSSMLLRDPVQLFAYTRAMMACLIFNDKPRSALLIGLGGGSLAKFLLHHFPECRVAAVESRASVADLAHRFFHLSEDPRLRIHIGEGGEFVRAVGTAQDGYDFLLVDAYDAAGMVSSVSGLTFFDACRARMAQHGILSINLWGGYRDGLGGTLPALQPASMASCCNCPWRRKATSSRWPAIARFRPLIRKWRGSG